MVRRNERSRGVERGVSVLVVERATAVGLDAQPRTRTQRTTVADAILVDTSADRR